MCASFVILWKRSSIRVELRPIVYHISCHQLQRCMTFCKTLLWPLDLRVLPASFIDKTTANDICCAKSLIIIDPIRCNWHCFGEPSIFLMPSPPGCLSFQNSKVQCRSFCGFCRKISSLQHLPDSFGHWSLELPRDCSPNNLLRWKKTQEGTCNLNLKKHIWQKKNIRYQVAYLIVFESCPLHHWKRNLNGKVRCLM